MRRFPAPRPPARGVAAAADDPRTWFGPDDRPWFERDDWASSAQFADASALRRRQALSFRETGVVVLPGAAAGDLCRSAIDALDPLFRRTAAPRLTNAAWGLEPLRRLASLPEVVDLLTFLYGRRPVPFQTLDFCTGTHQELHSDEFHFDSLPPRFMCGVWIALEPIGPDQGPLVYTPRHSAGAASTAKPLPFTADTGDALVWSSSVVHGGAPILDPTSSRWSHVTHSFFEVASGTRRVGPISAEAKWKCACRSSTCDGPTVMPRLDGRPPRFVHLGRRRAVLIHPRKPPPSWFARMPWRHAPSAISPIAQAWWSRLSKRIPRHPGGVRPEPLASPGARTTR
ncbi:MAG: phytanoyl-CoA dioxygenase family protein [Actinobacteria bacterium]|nr:phytanoyl-CoA dioxygenase family protein [Actinomycetota bacterium]